MRGVKWLGQLFLKHRRRLAPFVVLVGMLAVGGTVFEASPREVEIRYDLGPEHRRVVEARIVYLFEGEEVKGARFTWAEGAPPSLRHTVDLSPGRYEVRVDLLEPGARQRSLERALRVPAEGLVRIDLFDEAHAALRASR